MIGYNKELLVEFATKYLDRVKVKGFKEVNELTYLSNFFTELKNGNIDIRDTRNENPSGLP